MQDQQVSPQPSSVRYGPLFWLVALATFAALFRLAPPAISTIERGLASIRAPFLQMDNEEGALLYQAIRFREGESVYRRLDSYPLIVGTYPPLYLALNAAAVDLQSPSFASGRIISLASCIGIAILLSAIALIVTRTVTTCLLAGAIFLATYESFHWVGYYRVDLMAIFLSLCGLLAFLSIKCRQCRAIISIFFFVLAWYTKQTMIAAPVAAVITALIEDRRSGLKYLAGLAGALLVPFATLCLVTGGQFAIHTIVYNMNQFVWNDVVRWMVHVWLFYKWLLAGAALAIVSLVTSVFQLKRGSDEPRSLQSVTLLLYWILSTLGALSIGKSGSAENYLLEPLAATALLVSCAAGQGAVSSRKMLQTVSAAISLLILAHAWFISSSPLVHIAFNRAKYPQSQQLAAASEIASVVRTQSGDTWTEYAIFNVLAHRSIFVQPFIISELDRQDKIHPKIWYDDLRNKRFKLIVSHYDFGSGGYTNVYTPEAIEAINGSYEKDERLSSRGEYFVYWPKK